MSVCVQSLSCIELFVTPWPVACQAPLFMGFPRHGYWSGLPSPLSGDIPNLGIELASLALTGRFSTTAPLGKHIESG